MSQRKRDDDNLLIPAREPQEGYHRIVGPGEKGLDQLEFGRLILTQGDWRGHTGANEMAVDLYAGLVTVELELDGGGTARFDRLGGRGSIFEGQAAAVIVPPHTTYRFTAVAGKVDAAVFLAPAASDLARVAVVKPTDIVHTVVGRGDWQREVYTVIGNDAPTSMLLVGEVVNPGHWSGFPPHKHDVARAPEIVMEEVYYFQIRPLQGFGIIRVYTDPDDPAPFDRLYTVRDGDTVVIPRGYHPIVAAPGYTMKYTYVLAGNGRRFGAWTEEPQHAWVNNA